MNRIFDFLRSDLFLSLAGGFALGIVGMNVITPASAQGGMTEAARSISVGAPIHAQIQAQQIQAQ